MDKNELITTNMLQKRTLPLSLRDYITSNSEASRRNEESRINLYEDWLIQNGMDGITTFDLVAYKSFLLGEQRAAQGLIALSPASAAAHINSIRARYLYMLDKAPGKLRDFLYTMTPDNASPSDRKAFVDEIQLRIRERVQDRRATVQLVEQTDESDHAFIRLNYEEMLLFARKPLEVAHNHKITGIRDSTILSILCMTGIREDELVNLDVQDVHRTLSNHPALEVRTGKGSKQRMVPYGSFQDTIRKCVQSWCRISGIQSGALFRGLTKWGTVRTSRISKRAINNIVGAYPAIQNDQTVTLKPHDCRRTYARIMRYEFNLSVDAIAKNLGHSDTKTTLRYIGEIDIASRIPQRHES